MTKNRDMSSGQATSSQIENLMKARRKHKPKNPGTRNALHENEPRAVDQAIDKSSEPPSYEEVVSQDSSARNSSYYEKEENVESPSARASLDKRHPNEARKNEEKGEPLMEETEVYQEAQDVLETQKSMLAASEATDQVDERPYVNVPNVSSSSSRGALPRRPTGSSIPDEKKPEEPKREKNAECVAGPTVEALPYFWPVEKAKIEQSLKDSGVLGAYCARHSSQPGHYAITGISANIGMASLLFREEVEHNRYTYYAEIDHMDRRFHSVAEVVRQFNKEKSISFSTPLNYSP